METRYRQRYLDLIANPEVADTFVQREGASSVASAGFLDDRGFVEVDTPILVPIARRSPRTSVRHASQRAGRAAIPAHCHRALPETPDRRRVSDKVYEIGRVFRNEGIDQDHNPEFSLLESYEAYADYNVVMEMVESLVSSLAQDVHGSYADRHGRAGD